jgi:predicted nucleic acid-binding protein
MNVLVDTSIWSLAFRRKSNINDGNVLMLKELIGEGRAKIMGPIRQELLSGISNKQQFKRLREQLSFFEDINLMTYDYERGAELYNILRRNGVQGSFVDFLICAVAERLKMSIFTSDKDFDHFSKYINVMIFHPVFAFVK